MGAGYVVATLEDGNYKWCKAEPARPMFKRKEHPHR
jgi:hypothetical protein